MEWIEGELCAYSLAVMEFSIVGRRRTVSGEPILMDAGVVSTLQSINLRLFGHGRINYFVVIGHVLTFRQLAETHIPQTC